MFCPFIKSDCRTDCALLAGQKTDDDGGRSGGYCTMLNLCDLENIVEEISDNSGVIADQIDEIKKITGAIYDVN